MKEKISFLWFSIFLSIFLIAGMLFTGILVTLSGISRTSLFDSSAVAAIHAQIIYVHKNAVGANDGTSWANAYNDLQDALDEAKPGHEIWVAKGTYVPTTEQGGTGSQYRAFQMKNGVAIYGGFSGNEDPASFGLADRDFVANETILSGDLDRNGKDITDAYHVFYHTADLLLNETAVLDGFTITGGYSSGDGTPYDKDSSKWHYNHTYLGAGMYNDHCSPTIRYCSFLENTTGDGTVPSCGTYECDAGPGGHGAGMYNSYSSPTIINCVFFNNETGKGGWGKFFGKDGGDGGYGASIYNYYSSPVIKGCSFSENRTGDGGSAGNTYHGGDGGDGGAVFNWKSSPRIVSCIFSRNSTGKGGAPGCSTGCKQGYGGFGAAVCNREDSAPSIVNCIFSWNSTGSGYYQGFGGGMFNRDSHPVIINCTFYGNEAAYGGALESDYSDHKISNSVLWGNTAYSDPNGNEIEAWNSVVSVYYSDIQGGYSGVGIIDVDPMFVSPGNGDFHLQDDSPCIDSGSSNEVPYWVETDFEGDNRFFGDAVEMGADEARIGPSVVTLPATGVEETSAILNGIIENINDAGTLEVSFEWGQDPGPPFSFATGARMMTESGPFEDRLSGLMPETTYYFRVKAEGAVKTYFGAMRSFATPPQKDVFYINQFATGNNDGSSWDNAFTSLQDAINKAGQRDEIWIAEGVYKPVDEHGGSGDRYRSFQLKNGVAVYGGFPSSGDPEWEERNWEEFPTVLSGDVGTEGVNTDNCYHVFYHPTGLDLDNTALLDGVIITDGYADGTGEHKYGGGMFNSKSSPTLVNCSFANNFCLDWGGGMCNSSSSPVVTGCSFRGNSTEFEGGGMYNFMSSPVVTDCEFSNNIAEYGGGMGNRESSPVVNQCIFLENEATPDPGIVYSGRGGGMNNWHRSSPVITKCTFQYNKAGYGAGISEDDSFSAISESKFVSNDAEEGGGIWASHSRPRLTACEFTHNRALYGGGIINMGSKDDLPVNIEGCIFKENKAMWGGAICNVEESYTGIYNCQFEDNVATSDNINDVAAGGAICNDMPFSVEISDCEFRANRAYTGTDAIDPLDPDTYGKLAFGGGICNLNCSAMIKKSSFILNKAYWGGAISNRADVLISSNTPGVCNPTFDGCIIEESYAVNGAGVCNEALGGSECAPIITNCTFIKNNATALPKDRPIEDAPRNGGGISNYAGSWSSCIPEITNCIFSGNSAFHFGGAMSNYAFIDANDGKLDDGQCKPYVINCTFYNNASWGEGPWGSGGAMSNEWASPYVTNCIFWDNPVVGGPDAVEIYNKEASATISYCNIKYATGTYPGVNNINENPDFQDPLNNDFHLKAASPCIDSGNSSAWKIPDLDFEGDLRVIDGDKDADAAVDIGADEFAPPFINLVVDGQLKYPRESYKVFITATVSNQGNIDAAEQITVQFLYCEGNALCYLIHQYLLDPLPSGKSVEISTEWIPPPVNPKTYSIKIKVNSITKPQKESNEGDNTWEDFITPGNPVVTDISAEWDGLPGSSIGVFLKGISIENTFTVSVTSPNPVNRVAFELDGQEIEDADSRDGWSAAFDMGTIDPGIEIGLSRKLLTVRAYDHEDRVSPDKTFEIWILALPDWIENALSKSVPLKIGWVSAIAKWDPAEHCTHLELTISPKNPEDPNDVKKGENRKLSDDANSWGLGGNHKFELPEIQILLNYYLHGKVTIGGSVKFSMEFGEYIKAEVRGGLTGEIKTSTLELEKLIATPGATLGVTIPFDEIAKQLSDQLPGPDFEKVQWFVEGAVDSEIVLKNRDGNLDIKNWKVTSTITQGPTATVKIQHQAWCAEEKFIEQVYTTAMRGEFTMKFSYESAVSYDADVDNFPHFDYIKIGIHPEAWVQFGSILAQSISIWWEGKITPALPSFEYTLFGDNPSKKSLYADSIIDAPDIAQSPILPTQAITANLYALGSELTANGTDTFSGGSVIGEVVFSDDLYDDYPVVASDANNNVIAVWVHAIQIMGTPITDIYSSTWDGNSWSAPDPVVVDNNLEFHPSLAYIADTFMAIWAADAGNWDSNDLDNNEWKAGFEIYSSVKSGTGWTAPQRLTSNSVFDGMPSLASDGNSAIVVWVRDEDADFDTLDDREIYYCIWEAGSWGMPRQLTGNSLHDGAPQVAAKDKKYVIIWVRDTDGDKNTPFDQDIFYSLWNGLDWSAPGPVASDPNIQYREPSVTYNPDGEPVAVWIQAEVSNSGTNEAVYLSTLSGIYWSTPKRVSDHVLEAGNPCVAFDSGQNAMVVWDALVPDVGTLAVFNLYYSVRDGYDNSWSPAWRLTNGDVDWQPSMAIINDRAIVLWLRHSFGEDSAVPITDYDYDDDDDVYYLIHNIAPDIEVTPDDITFSNEAPLSGELVQIDALIHNNGDLDSESTIVRFFDGDPTLDGVQIGNDLNLKKLEPGKSTTLTITWTASQGIHNIYVTVDPENNLIETNENNNTASKIIRLLPDLSISSDDISFSDDNPLEGDNVILNVTIHNTGGSPSDDSTVRIYYGDLDNIGILLAEEPIGSIPHGKNTTVSIEMIGVTLGRHDIYVVVDENDLIDEYSNDNNTAQKPLIVTTGVNLVINSSDITFLNENPMEGDQQWIEATVHNLGNEDALEILISFFDLHPDDGGILIGKVRVARILKGGSCTVRLEPASHGDTVDIHDWGWINQWGLHKIYVIAEISNPADEGNTTNNIASKGLIIQSLGTNLAIQSADITFLNENPIAGGDQWIEAKIYNIGNEDASDIIVSFFDADPDNDGILIGQAHIEQILSGESQTVRLDPDTEDYFTDINNWSWVNIPGYHDIFVKVELSGLAPETDTTNNIASRTLIIQHQPERIYQRERSRFGCFISVISEKQPLLFSALYDFLKRKFYIFQNKKPNPLSNFFKE